LKQYFHIIVLYETVLLTRPYYVWGSHALSTSKLN